MIWCSGGYERQYTNFNDLTAKKTFSVLSILEDKVLSSLITLQYLESIRSLKITSANEKEMDLVRTNYLEKRKAIKQAKINFGSKRKIFDINDLSLYLKKNNLFSDFNLALQNQASVCHEIIGNDSLYGTFQKDQSDVNTESYSINNSFSNFSFRQKRLSVRKKKHTPYKKSTNLPPFLPKNQNQKKIGRRSFGELGVVLGTELGSTVNNNCKESSSKCTTRSRSLNFQERIHSKTASNAITFLAFVHY